jgi:hypothetical protein
MFSAKDPKIITNRPSVLLTSLFALVRSSNLQIRTEALEIITLAICLPRSKFESFLGTWELQYNDYLTESREVLEYLLTLRHKGTKLTYGNQPLWKLVLTTLY